MTPPAKIDLSIDLDAARAVLREHDRAIPGPVLRVTYNLIAAVEALRARVAELAGTLEAR